MRVRCFLYLSLRSIVSRLQLVVDGLRTRTDQRFFRLFFVLFFFFSYIFVPVYCTVACTMTTQSETVSIYADYPC